MNANLGAIQKPDRKTVLSMLWVFVMFNYVYADVYTLFFRPVLQPESWQQFLSGSAGGVQITDGFVLITAVLMETAIAMVLLSRILSYSANRWANVFLGAFHTLFVAWSLLGETPTLFYAFFAAVEIACTLYIVWYAWQWRIPSASSKAAAPASRAPTSI
jgi:uncharacterized protein DUF6326